MGRNLAILGFVGLAVAAALTQVVAQPGSEWTPGDLSSIRQAPARIDGPAARALVGAGAVLVDVRTPAEFAAGHVDGALNIPVDRIEELAVRVPDKTASVVVYCHSGRRSALAARKLQDLGYQGVYDLGPKSAW